MIPPRTVWSGWRNTKLSRRTTRKTLRRTGAKTCSYLQNVSSIVWPFVNAHGIWSHVGQTPQEHKLVKTPNWPQQWRGKTGPIHPVPSETHGKEMSHGRDKPKARRDGYKVGEYQISDNYYIRPPKGQFTSLLCRLPEVARCNYTRLVLLPSNGRMHPQLQKSHTALNTTR